MTELNELIQPGKAIKVYFSEGNINNHVAHIRAIVDDEFVVYRVWQKRRRRWDYRVDHLLWFQNLHDKGYLEAI